MSHSGLHWLYDVCLHALPRHVALHLPRSDTNICQHCLVVTCKLASFFQLSPLVSTCLQLRLLLWSRLVKTMVLNRKCKGVPNQIPLLMFNQHIMHNQDLSCHGLHQSVRLQNANLL